MGLLTPDAWKYYLNKWDGVEPEPKTESDNSIRFTTETILATAHLDLSLKDTSDFGKSLYKYILLCEQKPGLLRRNPENNKQEGFDDYIAALTASYFMDGGALARRIWDYGKKHVGIYCNGDDWGFFHRNPFLWRNPALMAYTYFCAFDSFLSGFEIILEAAIYRGARSFEQDSKVLTWMMCVAFGKKTPKIQIASQIFSKTLESQYPLGIGEVLGRYYSQSGYNHPNSKALMGVYD